jgi:NAD(P)-dependent dehydrogenase (short-subunit alcohol dehydrogenase family)
MTTLFEGKHVVVVGCGIGITGYDDIGRATAAAFAQAGAHVSVVQVTQDAADECVEAIRGAGGSATAYSDDPRDPSGIALVAERIAGERDVVDVLATHYFATNFSGVADLELAHWEETIRVNLTGPFASTKAFLPGLRNATHPTIVHASSIDGAYGNVNVPSFSASKGGLNALVHVLAAEFASEGIRVNAIARAASTAMPLKPEVYDELNRATPLARPADPHEYAEAMLFLASPASSYITGAVLPVDGGRTAVTAGCTPSYRGFGTDHRPSAAGYL